MNFTTVHPIIIMKVIRISTNTSTNVKTVK